MVELYVHSPHTCPWRDACTGENLPSYISASLLLCLHNPPKYSSDLVSDSCFLSARLQETNSYERKTRNIQAFPCPLRLLESVLH
jgi:hypothetical protein